MLLELETYFHNQIEQLASLQKVLTTIFNEDIFFKSNYERDRSGNRGLVFGKLYPFRKNQ